MFDRQKYCDLLLKNRNTPFIKIITGARRVGKSFLMNTIFYNKLIEEGFDKSHIIRFSFDNADDQDLLDNFYPELPTKIYYKKDTYYINSKKFRAYIRESIKDEQPYILLLDEIQILEDFVSTLNAYVGKGSLDVYVTGSNSELLSVDIDTRLRGRGRVIHVLPLSFKEFKEGISKETSKEISKEKTLNNEELYALYASYGGIPLIGITEDLLEKQSILASLVNETYIKDIINRYNIRHTSDLDDLFKFLASSIGSTISPTKLVNTFKSAKNKKICDETLTAYIKDFENSFIIHSAPIYNIKGKKYINSPFKVYFEDLGVRNAVLSSLGNDAGAMLENIIYNDLRYKGYNVSVGQLSYSEKNSLGILVNINSEIDFIAEKGYDKYYIQVCLNTFDDETFNRGIKSFNKIKDSFKKILVVKDGLLDRTTETGIKIIDIYHFLEIDDLIKL